MAAGPLKLKLAKPSECLEKGSGTLLGREGVVLAS